MALGTLPQTADEGGWSGEHAHNKLRVDSGVLVLVLPRWMVLLRVAAVLSMVPHSLLSLARPAKLKLHTRIQM